MVGWGKYMTKDQIEAIRHYVIKRAHEDKALEAKGG
jgi:quinohemoprotein ethanol dehydrogenase